MIKREGNEDQDRHNRVIQTLKGSQAEIMPTYQLPPEQQERSHCPEAPNISTHLSLSPPPCSSGCAGWFPGIHNGVKEELGDGGHSRLQPTQNPVQHSCRNAQERRNTWGWWGEEVVKAIQRHCQCRIFLYPSRLWNKQCITSCMFSVPRPRRTWKPALKEPNLPGA